MGASVMKYINFNIEHIPALLLGEESDKVYLFIHGKCGQKEEAEGLAELVCPRGYQVLSIDLPKHGIRKEEKDTFYPWHVVPELQCVMKYIKTHWKNISLYANSIGAWLSMISFDDIYFERCLFVSPIVDMAHLIGNMMKWANVTEEQLRACKEIQTDFGEKLSWQYLTYAKAHEITRWESPTSIIYGTKDHLMPQSVIENFSTRLGMALTVVEDGEHWFHTEEQLKILNEWVKAQLEQ